MRLGRVFEIVEKKILVGRTERPIIMLGPPGIGKTEGLHDLAKRVAKKLNKEFVVADFVDEELYKKVMAERNKYFVLVELRMSEILPEDFLGVPKTDTYGVLWYRQLAWVHLLKSGPGILFIDEANIYDEPSKAAVLFKVLEKKVGFSRLHKQAMVILAGNPPKDNNAARELPAPVINRAWRIYVEADPLDWLEWAKRNNVHPAVIAFIEQYPTALYKPPAEGETLDNFPTPRSWTNLAYDLNLVNEIQMTDNEFIEFVEGYVGREYAATFVSFYLSWKEMEKEPDELVKEYFDTTDFERRQKIVRRLLAEREKADKAFEALNRIAEKDPDIIYSIIYESMKEGKKPISRAMYSKIISDIDSPVYRVLREVAKALKEEEVIS